MADLSPAYKPSVITRYTAQILKLVTDIKPSEVRLSLALFATVFFMLMAYYIGKPVRDSWLAVSAINGLSSIEVKAFSGFLQSATLITLIPFYTKLYDKLPRGKLLVYVNIFFIACFPLFWLIRPGILGAISPYCGVAFYIWIGIFAVAVVAQFWTFAADIFDEASGKRLFPLIALGASAGAVIGSLMSKFLLETVNLNNYSLLLVAPVFLVLATFILWRVDKSKQANKAIENKNSQEQAKKTIKPEHASMTDKRSASKIILSSRYITLIALLIFMLNWIATNGENILYPAIQDTIAQTDFSHLNPIETQEAVAQATAGFYSRIYFWVNLMGTLLQAFVVSRLLKYGGLTAILMLPPVVSFASYGAMGSIGGSNVITTAYTAENATNYSVANTASNILWLPVSKCALYKAKAAIDTTVYRAADAIAAMTVIMGTRFIDISLKGFFMINMFLVLIWMLVVLLILKERKRWDGHSPIAAPPMSMMASEGMRLSAAAVETGE